MVDFQDNQVDPATGSIRMRAKLRNRDRAFTPGLYARVQVSSGNEVEAILIDDKAVLTDQDRKYVYVLGPDNTAQRKDIQPGRKSDGLRVVESGLMRGGQDHHWRIAENLQFRRAGEAIRSVNAGCSELREATMNISRFFIERPIFAIVLSIVIFLVGLIAIPLLPVGEYPEVVPPSVVVRATYPGANPKETAESVATPLEEAINGVEGIMYMKSVAGSDGSLQIVVTFLPERRSRHRSCPRAEPGEPGAQQTAGPGTSVWRDYAKAVSYAADVCEFVFGGQPL